MVITVCFSSKFPRTSRARVLSFRLDFRDHLCWSTSAAAAAAVAAYHQLLKVWGVPVVCIPTHTVSSYQLSSISTVSIDHSMGWRWLLLTTMIILMINDLISRGDVSVLHDVSISCWLLCVLIGLVVVVHVHVRGARWVWLALYDGRGRVEPVLGGRRGRFAYVFGTTGEELARYQPPWGCQTIRVRRGGGRNSTITRRSGRSKIPAVWRGWVVLNVRIQRRESTVGRARNVALYGKQIEEYQVKSFYRYTCTCTCTSLWPAPLWHYGP